MKYEFVEFYPKSPDVKNERFLGTVHLYIIDMNIDLRGILAVKMITPKNRDLHYLGYRFPGNTTIDEEGKRVFYPIINFVNPKDKKEWIDWMKKEVSPIIKERLNLSY